MRTTTRRPTLGPGAATIALFLSFHSARVQAQTVSAAPETDILAARAEFRQASSLAAAQAWAEALQHYETAYGLFAHPTTLYDIGVCHEKLGDDAQAYRYTLWALRSSTSEERRLAPEIRSQAEAALRALESRVAVVEFEGHGATLRVEVDGQQTTLLQTDAGSLLFVAPRTAPESTPFIGNARLILDPASHRVTLRDGSRSETRAIATTAGSRTSFQWSASTPSAPPKPAVTKQAPPASPVAPPPAANHTLQHVAIGSLIVGGAGLVAGVVAGGVALSAKNHLDQACSSDGNCPPSESSTMSRFDRAGTVSTVGFAIGLAASVAGVSILLLSPATKKAPTVALRLTPTQAVLLTTF